MTIFTEFFWSKRNGLCGVKENRGGGPFWQCPNMSSFFNVLASLIHIGWPPHPRIFANVVNILNESLKIYTFWVTVTQKIYILSDSHSKDKHFEWLSLLQSSKLLQNFWITIEPPPIPFGQCPKYRRLFYDVFPKLEDAFIQALPNGCDLESWPELNFQNTCVTSQFLLIGNSLTTRPRRIWI